jgi:hypothetical protein
MDCFSKNISLILAFILTVSTIVTIESASAQSMSKPLVPEFTLQYVDHSYDVAPTYSKDQYTGETVITQAGYHIQDKSIEVTIKNQPFTPYKNSDGNYIVLFYDVRWKGHFDNNDYVYSSNFTSSYYVASNSVLQDNTLVSPNAPSTVLKIGFNGNNGSSSEYYFHIADISDGGQADFQVQAYIGYYTSEESNPYLYSGTITIYTFHGQSSGWSSTQTITLAETTQTATPSPNQSSAPTINPTVTQVFSSDLVGTATLIVLIIIAMLLVFVVYYLRKRHGGSVRGQSVKEGTVVH